MADQTDFKHITVNPADSDDVVIHAGSPGPAIKQEGRREPSSPTRSEQPQGDDAQNVAPADAAAGKDVKRPSSDGSANSKPSKPAYRQTTLEDIQSFKMSKTQIAVIIVALAAIAAFVVWYLVFS